MNKTLVMRFGLPGPYKSSPFSFSSVNRCRQPAQNLGDLEMMEPQDGRGLAGPLSSKELKFSHNELTSLFFFHNSQPTFIYTVDPELEF